MYSGDSMLKGMEKDIPPHPCRQCEIKGSAPAGFQNYIETGILALFVCLEVILHLFFDILHNTFVQRSERDSWNWPGYSSTSPLHGLYILQKTSGSLNDPVVKVQSEMLSHTAQLQEWFCGYHIPVYNVIACHQSACPLKVYKSET